MAEINLGQMLQELGYTPTSQEYANAIKNGKMHGSMAQAPYYAANPVAANLQYFLPITLEYSLSNKPHKIELPFPVMTISGKKRLVETYLTQRNGTMKELISSDGYEINIRGYLIGKEGTFPEAEIKMLRELYEVNEPVTIRNVVADIFLYRPDPTITDKVVITELNFPEGRGNRHVREYEMKLVNDAPFNLSLIN